MAQSLTPNVLQCSHFNQNLNIATKIDFDNILGLSFVLFCFFPSLENVKLLFKSMLKVTHSSSSERINLRFQIFFPDLKIRDVI